MKKLFPLVILGLLFFTSCFKDKDDDVTTISISFEHKWDGVDITQNGNIEFPFTTKHGNKLNIKNLRYIISNITLKKETGEEIVLNGYYFIDVFQRNVFIKTDSEIPTGDYTNLSFTFGLNNNDNYLSYPELNPFSWSVTSEFGGGHHFLQMGGYFLDNTNTKQTYAYHMIRAFNTSTNDYQDTFFNVDFGPVKITQNASFNITMNAAEWFKNPYTWDLNLWHKDLLGNFEAQLKMHENGQDVFILN